jgi:superfamily I DNA/RNA helicase
VVVAGAGTGKTRVIVERVRHLLDTQPDLTPEQLLVLTYNVKAARELRERITEAVGPTIAARLTVSNFHSFCHRILTENAADAGMPPNPDVLDGIGQLLLIRELRPDLGLVYHSTTWYLGEFVKFINRAKDELVTPDDFDAFVATERQVFEDRYGSYIDAVARIVANGNLQPVRDVRRVYARLRRDERAGEEANPAIVDKEADKEARRTIGGTGKALYRREFPEEQHAAIDELAGTYVKDAAALEVMRLAEIASVYRAYQEKLAERGALDFGEQIAAVTQLFKRRPNVLRRWQRQYRYICVDEFQDANQDLYHAREPHELGVVMPESPPVFYLTENRRSTKAIHAFAARFFEPDATAPPSVALGPDGRPVEIFTYPAGTDTDAADACRRVLGTALRRLIDAGRVPAADVVMLTPRSHRSSWLMRPESGAAPVEAWPYRLMPEYGPEGSVLPPPTKGNEVRVATIHRYKGLESPVVVLAEIDERIPDGELGSLLYVGATRARSHLVIVASEAVAPLFS